MKKTKKDKKQKMMLYGVNTEYLKLETKERKKNKFRINILILLYIFILVSLIIVGVRIMTHAIPVENDYHLSVTKITDLNNRFIKSELTDNYNLTSTLYLIEDELTKEKYLVILSVKDGKLRYLPIKRQKK